MAANMRYRTGRAVAAATLLVAVLSACQSTTMGGAVGASRKQLLLVSSQEVNAGSAQAYRQTLTEAKSKRALNTNAAYTRRVKEISARLIRQLPVFLSLIHI